MHYSETEEGTVEFSVIANPYPEMDIYYRAFTYDGIHYNWGEERHFIVYNNLAISATSISIKEGETSTIYITSGSGQYGVTNLGGSIASATLQGTTIQIKGLSIGNAEVVVTDILSGQQIIIKVYVKKKEEPSTSPEAIDLGLTSRTLWASYNIGATKPEELGAFLAWGEIEEKDYYDTNTYLYNNIELGKNIAGTNYDVAHILWGGAWVMPTQEQLKELFNYCKIEWTTIDGTKGCILTGPNGNNIFMPVGGWKEDDEVYQAESGNYWSSESTGGWFFDETYGTSSLSSPVYRGLLVRPVQIGEYKDVPAPAIDMGLPSGTKWAQYNVGAVNWEDCGGYYAWGETEEKSIYSWDTYEHCDGTGNSLHNIGDNIVGTEYDVAHVRWGGDWRMPTDEDYQELFDNCTFVFGKTKNNVVGIQFTGPNGNKLFFPAAGYRSNETLLSKSSYGRYWSGQLLFKIEEYPYNESIYSHSFEFSRSSSTLRLYSMQRSYGYSVRPVTK